MGEFKTLQDIEELFKRVDCIGDNNCFFYSLTNIQSISKMMVGSDELPMSNMWDGFLINDTEKGIGLIPLENTKSVFVIKPENMIVHLEDFIFINKNEIESIKIRRLNFISAVAKEVNITLKNGAKYNLMINNKEKSLEYHEMNFSKFINKYKK